MPRLHADGTTKRPYTTPSSAANALQKHKYLGFLSRLEQIRQTSSSNIFSRVDFGLELIDMLVNIRYSSGSMTSEFRHALFDIAKDALTLMLEAVEERFHVRAHEMHFEEELTSHQQQRRPTSKDPRTLREWAIKNQMHAQKTTFADPISLDAGKEVLALCLCLPYTFRLKQPHGQAVEDILLPEIRLSEMWNDRADFGRRALLALAGFGRYLLHQFREWECLIGGDGFGVRRFDGRINGLNDFEDVERWRPILFKLSVARYGDWWWETEEDGEQ